MNLLDMTAHTALIKRLDECDQLIRQFKGPANVRMDMKRLYSNVHIQYVRLDNILVDCRRTGKFNSQYKQQAELLAQMLASIEKRITWAYLL